MQGVALYSRVAARLKARILDGEWEEGHTIPAIPMLCEQYGVGTITVRQALGLLAAEGLVSSQRGRGTIVTSSAVTASKNPHLRKAINDPLELGPEQSIQLLRKERVSRLPAALDGPGGTGDYVRIQKLHLHRGAPFALIDIYLAEEDFRRLPKGAENRAKIAKLLRDAGGTKLVSMKQELTIVPLDGEPERLLRPGGGSSPVETVLVRILKWWRDNDGRLIFVSENHYRSDMFVLDIERDVSDFFKDSSSGLIPRPVSRSEKRKPR